MTFSTIIDKLDGNLWGYHLVVPNEVAAPFIKGKDRRVWCQINETPAFQCALMPSQKKGTHFIHIHKTLRKEMGLTIGMEVEVTLKKDESKYGLPMPEEMQVLLDLDDIGNKHFHSLTPGKQRSLLYIIGKPKSSEKRAEKAVVVIEYLKSTRGKLDFKELNVAFKEWKY